MRIFWRFTSDAEDASVTATTTADGYDVEDLRRSNLQPVWKSTTAAGDQTLTVDLGAATAITAFALLGHNLIEKATYGSVTLEYATDSGFTTGTGTIGGTAVTQTNWYEYFASITRRYWRVVIPKASASNQIEAGRILIGAHYTPSYGVRDGFVLGPGASTDRTVTTNAGTHYGSLGVAPRVLNGTTPGFDDDDFDEINVLQDTYQTSMPFVLSLNWETDPTRRSIYGVLTRVRPMTNVAISLWEWQLSMREVL